MFLNDTTLLVNEIRDKRIELVFKDIEMSLLVNNQAVVRIEHLNIADLDRVKAELNRLSYDITFDQKGFMVVSHERLGSV